MGPDFHQIVHSYTLIRSAFGRAFGRSLVWLCLSFVATDVSFVSMITFGVVVGLFCEILLRYKEDFYLIFGILSFLVSFGGLFIADWSMSGSFAFFLGLFVWELMALFLSRALPRAWHGSMCCLTQDASDQFAKEMDGLIRKHIGEEYNDMVSAARSDVCVYMKIMNGGDDERRFPSYVSWEVSLRCTASEANWESDLSLNSKLATLVRNHAKSRFGETCFVSNINKCQNWKSSNLTSHQLLHLISAFEVPRSNKIKMAGHPSLNA